MKVTFGKIIENLKQIGYVEKRISNSHVILFNTEHNSTIVLPAFKKNKIAEIYLIRTIQKNVVEKGIMTKEDFDKLIDT